MSLTPWNFLIKLSLKVTLTFERVEADVEEGQILELKDFGWKAASEAVVADVELVEVRELGEGGGDGASELVGVGMEEGQVRQLVYESFDRWGLQLEAIEVDGGEGVAKLVVRWDGAVEALEFARVTPHP